MNIKIGGFIHMVILVLVILGTVAGVYLFFMRSTSQLDENGLPDAQFIAAVGSDADETKILARGDINEDGFEDAIVEQRFCEASCSFDLKVVFNINNEYAKLFSNSTNDRLVFEPSYVGSSAMKSEITEVSITDGKISLTGYGLACGDLNTGGVCTEGEWETIKTVTYEFDGKDIVQISVARTE